MMTAQSVWGLRDSGDYKLYELWRADRKQIVVGHKTPLAIRRTPVTRKLAEQLLAMTEPEFRQSVEQHLQNAKGSVWRIITKKQ